MIRISLRIIGPTKTRNGELVSFVPLPRTDERSGYAAYRFHSDPSGEMTLMWREDNYAYPCRKEGDTWISRIPFTDYIFERYEKSSPEYEALETLLENADLKGL